MDLKSLFEDDDGTVDGGNSHGEYRDAGHRNNSREDMLERMRNIDPYKFEQFIADLWSAQGWQTDVSQASNDMGVDVVATKSDGMVDQKVAIQAKRYSAGNKVGQPKIQQYHALKEQDTSADAAVVITTSSFTSNGREWASNHNVKLIDGDDLVDIIENQYEYILEEYAPSLDEIEIEETTMESDAPVGMPQVLRENHETIAAAIGVAGIVILVAGELSNTAVIGAMLALGLAGGLYFAPEKVWELATGEQTVIRTFPSGAAVVEQGGDIKYVSNEGETKKFDTQDGKQITEQRAVVYAQLKETHGDFQEIEGGAVPTSIVSAGDEHVTAYRFAVHEESPATIAADMDLTQKEIKGYLSTFTN